MDPLFTTSPDEAPKCRRPKRHRRSFERLEGRTLPTGVPAIVSIPAPSLFALGDFNGDGRIDLAYGTGVGLSVFQGTGDGTFAPPVTYLAGSNVVSLAAVDLNGDGRPDLVAGTGGTIAVLLGTGDGTFGLVIFVQVADGPLALFIASFSLQMLGKTPSLPLVATLLTTTLEETPAEPFAIVATAALPNQPIPDDHKDGGPSAAALPNQPIPDDHKDGGPSKKSDLVGQDDPRTPPTSTLSTLARVLYGLDEKFERVRHEASQDRHQTGVAERSLVTLDAVLIRWSPIVATLGGPLRSLSGGLIRVGIHAARLVDTALEAISVDSDEHSPRESENPATPAGRDPMPTVPAATSLGILAVARVVADGPRHRPRRHRFRAIG
jgi:FG-GAP-like repeat